MIPRGSDGVRAVAATITSTLAPAVTGTQAAADARLASMLIEVVAEELERTVDVLVTDRRGLQELFVLCRDLLDGPLLALVDDRLEDDAGGRLLVSELQRRGDEDVRALGLVMAEVEEVVRSHTSNPSWQGVLDACWRFIEEFTERRRLTVLM